MTGPWFGAKEYGIGISPKSSAGWISLGIYALAMVATGPIARHFDAPLWVVWATFAFLTIGLLVLIFAKSDRRPWRWRWGRR
jgi:hypothetical protein